MFDIESGKISARVTGCQRAHFDVIHRATGLPALFSFVLAREDYRDSNHSNAGEDHALPWGPVAEYPLHCSGTTCVNGMRRRRRQNDSPPVSTFG